ncbi:MAG: hypothetical protein IJL32_11215 [Oscillospiraceae bacterium]|nr:hypothetical protein [Oscillospiraceae bacterium]
MSGMYYLCFSVNRLPDLTLRKYSVFDGSGVDNIMEKHGVFLRQLHRLGFTSNVYFHLLYYYNPDKNLAKGQHLTILFYATAKETERLNGIREFLTTSVLSTYYDFFCYETAREMTLTTEQLADGSEIPVLQLRNIAGEIKRYSLGDTSREEIEAAQSQPFAVCEIAPDADEILSFNSAPVDEAGRIVTDSRFAYAAFLTKKDYSLPAQNRLPSDSAGEVLLWSVMEWEPCENGRLYNVLKLMEGYDRSAVLRVDIFPVEHTQAIRQRLPYAETRRRISDRDQGKDDNSENIVKSWDKYLGNLMKFPQFIANVTAFAESQDIAVMLADSVAAEAVESGTYLIETLESDGSGFDMYYGDDRILHAEKEEGNFVAPFLSLYTLEEIRPMFSFPILYPGESIELQKETDPKPFSKEMTIDPQTGVMHEVISLGTSSMGYDVTFPVELFKKHAFISGVPGAGKTNTMLYLVTTLWRDTQQHIPFLVLEPAKQEYRALAMIPGMEELCVFSPGADTRFPLHINPFQFPVGLTLAEHIANLNAVFAGAFELIPPSPFLIDRCIEQVYLNKGWNINERNDGSKPYPTMQELYDSLKVAVEESGYEGESRANIRSVMEVRIGSLLRREIGNVYNVRESSMQPEEWLECPVIIELEALGEGPANFMSLLISTLIREVLKIRKTSDTDAAAQKKREISHIIFYEEAHNLIGPTTDDPAGGSVNPKISATKYLVKMLAEVRALGEGIVIADQLPTAMAPEVLKNTGLKLGHRITAQDDRNLLGSTMSASVDQLEEQGTFGTGQALVFYEGLQKPFKMRVAEWERGASRSKYESPTNMQLFRHLRDNRTYDLLLRRSADIMQDKEKTEYEILYRQAEKLKTEADSCFEELERIRVNLRNLNKRLGREQDPEQIRELQQHIANAELMLKRKSDETEPQLRRNLTKLCRNYANQFYACMTLANNYDRYSEPMYICAITEYLRLFDALQFRHDMPELNDILLRESADVLREIGQYVDLEISGKETPLPSGAPEAVVLCNRYFGKVLAKEAADTAAQFRQIAENGEDAEETVTELTDAFAARYQALRNRADAYLALCDDLAQKADERAVHFAEGSKERQTITAGAGYFRSRRFALHEQLAWYVVRIAKAASGFLGVNRKAFLVQTQTTLADFRQLVEYRSPQQETLLSGRPVYAVLRQEASDLLCMEIGSRFALLNRQRAELLKNGFSAEAYRQHCVNVHVTFLQIVLPEPDSFAAQLLLINHYVRFLTEMSGAGAEAMQTAAQTAADSWRLCRRMMKQLSGRIPEEKRTEWLALTERMQAFFPA